MTEVKCPRCNNSMRWIRRMNIFFCNTDGYILGPDDPYVKKGEVIEPYNTGGKYND